MAKATLKERKAKKPPPSISGISVRGFKSIAHKIDLSIKPLTVLAGPNSSGKSSFMQPLLLIKQTLDSSYDPGALRISGPNAHFSDASQIFSRTSATKQCSNFSVEITDTTGATISCAFSRDSGQPLGLDHMTLVNKLGTVILTENMSRADVLSQMSSQKPYTEFIEKSLGRDENNSYDLTTRRDRSFIAISLPFVGSLGINLDLAAPVSSAISRLIHVPGFRGHPERTYPHSAVGGHVQGVFTSYVASIIHNWVVHHDSRLHDLAKDLSNLGLTWKVSSRKVDDTRVEIEVGRLPKAVQGGAHDMVNIADVGFGVSQCMPVLVALLYAAPGQIVYVEQPELHLHPRAQVALAEVMARAAKRGVRVIVETHSSLLLMGLQILVADKKLDSDLISLNWFARNKQSGATDAWSANVDKFGAFGSWPVDFGEIELEVNSRYLAAVEKQRSNLSKKV